MTVSNKIVRTDEFVVLKKSQELMKPWDIIQKKWWEMIETV